MITEAREPEIFRSRQLRLVSPFQVEESEFVSHLEEGFVVVEPTLASICHADLRYFGGLRNQEILAQKLPMALIHEGIGKIIISKSSTLPVGTRVVIVPNVPGYVLRRTSAEQCCPACRGEIQDNYCDRGYFLGSGKDGIAQSRLMIPEECIIPIPADVPDEIAVLSELCSVSIRAARCVSQFLSNHVVAVFGDGPVGYITAAVLHHAFQIPKERLVVFGAVSEKLSAFTFAQTELVQDFDFLAASAHVVFECTGGHFSESAINQGIDLLARGGHLVLMGVSEERVPINTRDVLEKGITLHGSSRSSRIDFEDILQMMKSEAMSTLSKLLPEQDTEISNAADFTAAMQETLQHKGWHKTLLQFKWS